MINFIFILTILLSIVGILSATYYVAFKYNVTLGLIMFSVLFSALAATAVKVAQTLL